MITISVCMIVKNEEKHLARCLDSLQGLWDELVIVDTGSTDDTRKIAEGYTDRVYDYQWRDDFAHARNHAFSLAQCDYIYAPDADEVLAPEARRKFSQLKQTLLPEIEIIHMPDSSHASRDLKILRSSVQKGFHLSARLHNMYARELYIAGTPEELKEAESFFHKSMQDPTRSEDEHMEALCILARINRIKKNYPEFLSLCLNGIAAAPCAELCIEAGDYYMEIQDHENARDWYENARNTPPILDIRCQEKFPTERLTLCETASASHKER